MLRSLPVCLCLLLFAFVARPLAAQPVQVALQMNPNPSPWLSDWQNRSETATIIVTNRGTDERFVRITTQVSDLNNGDVLAETDPNLLPPLELVPGINRFDAADILPYAAVRLAPRLQENALRTGRIPAGRHQICVQVLDAETMQELSQLNCRPFDITNYQAPVLINPVDGDVVQQDELIVFRWSPLTPPSTEGVIYRLAIFEVPPGQNALNMFRNGVPLFTQDLNGQTQIPLPLGLEIPVDLASSFIWSVQALDQDERPLSDPDGWAKPFLFTFASGTQNECVCRECFINGVRAEMNGVIITPGNRFRVGDKFVLHPNVITDCPPDCPLEVNVRWFVTMTEDDGTTYSLEFEGPTLPVEVDRAGDAQIDYEVSVRCGGRECRCGQSSGSTRIRFDGESVVDGPITEGPSVRDSTDKLRGDSTIVRDPVRRDSIPAEGEPRDSIPVVERPPWERIPPDSLRDECVMLPFIKIPARGIDVGMIVDEPKTFPYPRAVPIRADAVDWDYAIFGCDGCGDGPDEYWKAVRDNVRKFTWKLDGKGSLNLPFSADSATSIEEQLVDLVNRKAALQAERDERRAERDSLPAELQRRKDIAQGKIDNIDSELNRLDSAARIMIDSLGALTDSISIRERRGDELAQRRTQLRDSVSQAQTLIDSLDAILRGDATQVEQDSLAAVRTAREAAERADSSLRRKSEELLSESERLAQEILNAERQVQTANADYEQLKQQSNGLSTQITTIETQLFADPRMRRYLEHLRTWTRQSAEVVARNFSGTNLHEDLVRRQSGVARSADRILELTALPRRRQAFREFQSKLAGFLSKLRVSCAQHPDTSRRGSCASDAAQIAQQSAGFEYVVDTTASGRLRIDPVKRAQLNQLRNQLDQVRGQIVGAAATVQAAAQAVIAARNNFAAQVQALSGERDNLAQLHEKAAARLAEAETNYSSIVDTRRRDLELNRENYLSRRGAAQNLRDQGLHGIELVNDSLGMVFNDTTQLRVNFVAVQADTAANMQMQRRLRAVREGLTDVLNINLQDQLDALDKIIAALDKDIADLQAQVDALRARLAALTAGNKTADGVIAYYIPPPLEEIMQDKSRFEELKDSVRQKRVELAEARAAKIQAQKTLAKWLENLARQLVRLKQAKDLESALTAERDSVDRALARLRTTRTRAFQDEQRELQDQLDQRTQERDAAQQRENQAVQDTVQAHAAVARARSELQNREQERDLKQRDYDAAQSQRDFESRQLDAMRLTLEQHANELNEARSELDRLRDRAEETQNALSRETARNDLRGAGRQRVQLNSRNQEVKNQQDEVARLESQLAQSSDRHETRARGFTAADSIVQHKRAALVQARLDAAAARDTLENANNELREALSGWLHWRDERRDAEGAIANTNRERRVLQDSVAARVNDDNDVRSKREALAAFDADIQAAKDAQTAAATAAGDILQRKDELLQQVDHDIKQAEDALRRAEDHLRTFLVNEFNTVTHTVTITLEADDEPADAYRSDDPKKQLVRQLSYRGNRVPVFKNNVAGYTLGDFDKNLACPVNLSFIKPADPTLPPPTVSASEPRTIALMYENGRKLWPEWPVIPASETNLLAKDVVPVATLGRDSDRLIQVCEPQPPNCEAPPDQRDGIRDLGKYKWSGDGRLFNQKPFYETILWEPPDPAKSLCEEPKEVKTEYTAAEIKRDDPLEKSSKPVVKAGVLIEVPDSLVGAPTTNKEVTARVVRGDHSGLSGEDVEFSVTLTAGEAVSYGFDGSDSLVTRKTDGGGVARTTFNFGEGFARFTISVRWLRAGTVCRSEQFDAVSPLNLQPLRFSNGPPDFAFQAAKQLWSGGGNPATIVNSFPDSRDEDAETNYAGRAHAMGGYWDEDVNYVNDIELMFRVETPRLDVDPESDTTELFGMGRTLALDPPEEELITILESCDERYEDVCRPPEVRDTLSTKSFDRFKIGVDEQLFTVVLDEPATPGDLLNSSGKLDNSNGQFVALLSDLELNIVDVELEENDAGEQIARGGYVVWRTPAGFETTMWGFTVTLDSLVVRAQMGAGIGGGLKHRNIEDPMSFYAEVDTVGNFLGTVSHVPGIEVGGFKLRDGTRFSIDMHEERSMPGFAYDFKGIVIHNASLELPPIFKDVERGRPPTLSVQDFAIAPSGLSGEISLGGTLFQAGFAGYLFEIDSLAIGFKDNELNGNGYFGGAIGLPSPFEGTLRVGVGRSGETWAATVSTDDPVSIPRLNTAFMLRNGTGISYDEGSGVGTLTISAVISSENYGEMDISGFEINSLGEIKADEIRIDRSISFGRGFDLHVNTIAFALSNEEYSLEMQGGFAMPLIGIEDVTGTVSIAPGPTVAVAFNKAHISFEAGPVEFAGAFEYSGTEFKGEFDIGIKKLINNGLSGMLVIGSAPIDSLNSYTYWYAEMTLGTRIPLGQTGLSLLELGGGVGYNYNPPIGSQEGSPAHYDDYSFKAVIGIGNTPGGEVFAGRLSMVLTPGVFSLNGKMWLLQMEDNLFGEGQLNLRWAPTEQLDGFVRMFIALPDADGGIAQFNGKINYLYSPTDFYIKSEELSGSLFQALNLEGDVDISSDRARLHGKLFYEFNNTFPFGVVDVIVALGVNFTGDFDYVRSTSTLNASASFEGYWDVDLDTPLGTANLISGRLFLAAQLQASTSRLKLAGTAQVSWDVWIYADSAQLDVGFETSL